VSEMKLSLTSATAMSVATIVIATCTVTFGIIATDADSAGARLGASAAEVHAALSAVKRAIGSYAQRRLPTRFSVSSRSTGL